MNNIKTSLECSVNYIIPYLPLVNSHMVTYLTQDLWNNILPHPLRTGYYESNEIQILDIFENSLNQNIRDFVTESKNISDLSILNLVEFKQILKSWGCKDSREFHCEQFMSSKKSHEVAAMADIIESITKAKEVSHIVDLGDGKGYLSSILALEYKLNVLGIDSSPIKTTGAGIRIQKIQKHLKSGKNANTDIYKQHTQFIDTKANIKEIVIKEFGNFTGLGLVGLHTCGSLAPVSLKHFVNCSDFYFLLNVACCYHLMEENDFPMSNFLKNKSFILERNARMLSLQPPDRIFASRKIPSEALMYRAVFEQMLQDAGHTGKRLEVGRIFSKCKNFIDYVKKASSKTNTAINKTDEEINSYYLKFTEDSRKLEFFFMVRVFLAPVIEKIILLDRLVFLQEQGFNNSYLVKLFDPVISPRCLGIVAMRDNPTI